MDGGGLIDYHFTYWSYSIGRYIVLKTTVLHAQKESPFSPLYRLFQAVKMGLQVISS